MRQMLLVFFAFLALIVGTLLLIDAKPGIKVKENGERQGESPIGGDFTLLGANGQEVKDASFRGKYMLVFFGFTACPDICPTTLATLSSVLESLGEKAAQVVPVFISVDPARDTPAVIKEYLTHFDPRIVGLTGTSAQVEQVASAYKVYYAKAEDGDEQNYMINHSGYIYLMAKDGTYLRHFSAQDASEEIAGAVRGYIK